MGDIFFFLGGGGGGEVAKISNILGVLEISEKGRRWTRAYVCDKNESTSPPRGEGGGGLATTLDATTKKVWTQIRLDRMQFRIYFNTWDR